jgi:hypothetical protein
MPKIRGYWTKRHERFSTRAEARARAEMLRQQPHVAHVTVRPHPQGYEVTYAVATWYLEALRHAGVRL